MAYKLLINFTIKENEVLKIMNIITIYLILDNIHILTLKILKISDLQYNQIKQLTLSDILHSSLVLNPKMYYK